MDIYRNWVKIEANSHLSPFTSVFAHCFSDPGRAITFEPKYT